MELFNWIDHEDGGATFTVELERDEVILFAKEGIMSTLLNAAKRVIEQHGNEQTENNQS